MISPARIHVRFSDLDILGHVNNSVYLSYFEIARVHYFGELLGKNWNWKKYTVVLVKNEIEYLRPVHLHDEVFVELNTSHIGEKSFTLSYKVYVDGNQHAKGSSVLVAWDAEKGTSMSIHPLMKDALQQLISE